MNTTEKFKHSPLFNGHNLDGNNQLFNFHKV